MARPITPFFKVTSTSTVGWPLESNTSLLARRGSSSTTSKNDNQHDKSIKYVILPSADGNAMTLPFKVTSRWIVYILTCLIVLLAVYTVAGDRGAIHLWRLRGEKAKLDEQNFRLQKETEVLRERVDRACAIVTSILKNSPGRTQSSAPR